MAFTSFNARIETLLRGAFDMNVGAGPSLSETRVDAMEAAQNAHEAGLRGFALRCDSHSTGPLAQILSEMYPGLEIVGTIVLGQSVGGINPDAVDSAARLGARIVWMPPSADESDGLLENGRIGRSTIEVLEVAAVHDMVIFSGGLAPDQAAKLFMVARKHGLERLVAPSGETMGAEEIRLVTETGAFIEFAFSSCLGPNGTPNPKAIVASITRVGTKRCLVTTGESTPDHPPPSEGLRMAIARLLNNGLSDDDIDILIKQTPARVLGLSALP